VVAQGWQNVARGDVRIFLITLPIFSSSYILWRNYWNHNKLKNLQPGLDINATLGPLQLGMGGGGHSSSGSLRVWTS
jgi:hypothetical protein